MHWKQALWELLDRLSVRRLTAHVALSAGLLGLGSGGDAGAQPRVPVSPVLTPETTVRRFKGRYVLKRAANAFFVHLADHRSHSSHSSHASHSSHSSHSSSSHYSGSHFSSSAPAPRSVPSTPEPEPAPAPPPPQPIIQTPPPPPPKPAPLLRETFDDRIAARDRWTVGVIATAPETFDATMVAECTGSALRITPLAETTGVHFSGFISQRTFNLATASIAAEVRRNASGGATTLFAAAIDSANWVGFRIEGSQLTLESRTGGRVAAKHLPYDAQRHRFLRLRMSNVAPVVAWETSADGKSWNVEHVETAHIPLNVLRIALSAGTARAIDGNSAAVFDNVMVEAKR